jgi:hypothetical protein
VQHAKVTGQAGVNQAKPGAVGIFTEERGIAEEGQPANAHAPSLASAGARPGEVLRAD